jgi:hypothetical protein
MMSDDVHDDTSEDEFLLVGSDVREGVEGVGLSEID